MEVKDIRMAHPTKEMCLSTIGNTYCTLPNVSRTVSTDFVNSPLVTTVSVQWDGGEEDVIIREVPFLETSDHL